MKFSRKRNREISRQYTRGNGIRQGQGENLISKSGNLKAETKAHVYRRHRQEYGLKKFPKIKKKSTFIDYA